MPTTEELTAAFKLFDTDGSHTLSQKEWSDGNAALDLATSDEEWQMLVQRFGGNDDESNETPGEISFANVVDLFGDIVQLSSVLRIQSNISLEACQVNALADQFAFDESRVDVTIDSNLEGACE